MTFEEAKKAAKLESKLEQCTKHVNLKLKATPGSNQPTLDYYTSDWYDSDSTVTTYTNGNEH